MRPVPDKPVGADGRKRAATVVIPVHDGAQVVIACLDQRARLGLHRHRIVVVDDGSSDAGLIATLDDLARQRKISLLRRPDGLGLPGQRERGNLSGQGP